jgi:cell pole-organizing protein PopZ
MAEQSAHEPTMEEILASIRRIISEDDAPEDAKAEPEVEVEEEPEAVAQEPEPEVEDEPEDDDVLELTETYEAPASVSIGDIDAFDAPSPAPVAAAPAPKPTPSPVAPSNHGGLVSERTESIAASSFGALTSNLLVPHSDRTLEDVVKELLRPQLQAWLDENLPSIVEEQVRLEVERIARQSRR